VIAAIESRIGQLDVLLRAHAGGLELRDVDHAGHVVVRYTGMCAGCPWKPLTTEATVRPALMATDGVTAVEVEGSRISDEAQRRIAAAFAPPSCGSEHTADGAPLET
jgi:Fe-S cluster biogenesis protein NfuA